jgi:hypothetical protein
VAGKDDAFRVIQLRAGNDGIAVAYDVQFRDGPQGSFDGVRQLRLIPGHTVDVHDRGCKESNILAEV